MDKMTPEEAMMKMHDLEVQLRELAVSREKLENALLEERLAHHRVMMRNERKISGNKVRIEEARVEAEESNRDCMIFKKKRQSITTEEMVRGLESREGVQEHNVEPHKKFKLEIDIGAHDPLIVDDTGPVRILVIKD